MRLCLLKVKTQHSELGVGLSVTDPHRDLNAAGVTIALDQVGACGLCLQLQAPLLTAGRLSTLLAARLSVLKLLTCPRIPTLTSGELVLLADTPTRLPLRRHQRRPLGNACLHYPGGDADRLYVGHLHLKGTIPHPVPASAHPTHHEA